MADVAFIRLTDYQDKHPVILAISRIISVCPVLDFEDASGVGVMVATRIEYDNDGGDTPFLPARPCGGQDRGRSRDV
jgi:hypothetical protein